MSSRIPLNERPAKVASRTSAGHWEADLMAFSRYGQNLLMLHERMSRALIGVILPSKHAAPVAQALAAALEPLPRPLRRTITFDNGTEFARHYELNALGIDTFFCDPHALWQKGGIENAIGRMRRTLSRKKDPATIEPDHLLVLLARRLIPPTSSTPASPSKWQMRASRRARNGKARRSGPVVSAIRKLAFARCMAALGRVLMPVLTQSGERLQHMFCPLFCQRNAC